MSEPISPLPDSITLRPVEDGDSDFLFALFQECGERTFGMLDLPPEEKRQLLEMQFNARNTGWHNSYPECDFQLILVDGKRAGEWYTSEADDRIILVNAALLEEFRGRGIAAALTRRLMAMAASRGLAVLCHVEIRNPAKDIWLHLGFRIVDDDGGHYRLEYSPTQGMLE